MLPKLALCLGLLLRPVLAAQNVNNPTPDNYLRRAFSAVTILENWIYIDGGEVSQILDGKKPDDKNGFGSKAMNATLAIDMNTSWLASTVKIRETKRPTNKNDAPPPMDVAAIWNDPSGKSFYVYGGIAPYLDGADRVTNKGIWKFTPDTPDRNSGEWSLESPSNPSVLNNIRKTFDGSYVTVDMTNTGYWIGGYAEAGKTEDPSSKLPGGVMPGLVSYNMATGEWKNDTASDLTPRGILRGAGGIWLPRFGPNGLVTFLGGRTYDGSQPLTNLTFFDPVTRKSYSQTTTGDAPSPRKDFCSVVVESPRGGHEVFIFGGAHPIEGFSDVYEDVYVLTLPGFQWFKVDDTFGGPRSSHTCVVAGQRQMISIGGVTSNNFNNFLTTWGEPDTFGQGLGIFDMTALTWNTKGQYDAYAKKYVSPDVVNEWYDKTGDLSKRPWSSNEVQSLFVKEDTTKPTDGDSQNNNNTKTASSSSPIGAIVGGVVGAVVVVIILGLVWFLIRRRNRKAAAANTKFSALEHNSPPQQQHYPHSPQSGIQELQESPYPQELQQSRVSPDQVAKHYVPMHSQELPASYAASELPSSNAGTRWELDSTPVFPPARQ